MSSAGFSAQLMHIDSVLLTDRLSELQQQIEVLITGKANKADLEAMQLCWTVAAAVAAVVVAVMMLPAVSAVATKAAVT